MALDAVARGRVTLGADGRVAGLTGIPELATLSK